MSKSAPSKSGVKESKGTRRKGTSSKNRKRIDATSSPTKIQTSERVNPEDVILKQGSGGPTTGGMPGGFFWHIFHQSVRVGKVFINYDNDTKEVEVQIFINRKSQGKGIGRVAYRKACEESGYSEIYASMRKNNIASIKAAIAAGFQEVPSTNNQITMLWKKQ